MSERHELTVAHLQNGIPVINYANNRLNVPAIVIEAGTFDDPPHLEGAAHGTEHVVCGSSNTLRSEDVVLDMEEMFGGTDGADINVRTMWTSTVYSNLDMPNRKECFRAFMLHGRLVVDAVVECHNNHKKGQTFSLDSVLCERTAVATEVAWRMQDPYIRLSDGLHYRLYVDTTNPAKLAGTGNTEQFRKLKPETLKSWAARFYVPKRITLVGIGPTQKEMLDWADKAGFDKLHPYRGPKPTYHHADQPHLTGVHELIMTQPGMVQLPNGKWIIVPSHTGLAWPTETFLTDDGPALEVLARILKMRIEMRLRDENRTFGAGIYHPAGNWWSTKYHGLLELWFAVLDQSYAAEGEAAVLDIVRGIKDEKSEAMDRQCRVVRKNLAGTVEQDWKWYPDRIMERIVNHWTNGDRHFTRLYSLRERLMKVRPQDVRRVANKYLTADRYVRAEVRSQYIPRELYDRAPEELRPYLQHFLRPAP